MRKTLLALAFAAAPLLIAPIARGVEPGAGEPLPNWVRIAVSHQGEFDEFIDANSLAMRDGLLTAWFLKNYDEPQAAAGKPYQSSKGVRVYDCSGKRSGAIAITLYAERGGKGAVVDSRSRAPSAESLQRSPPDSVGAALVDFVCSLWEKRRASPHSAPSNS